MRPLGVLKLAHSYWSGRSLIGYGRATIPYWAAVSVSRLRLQIECDVTQQFTRRCGKRYPSLARVCSSFIAMYQSQPSSQLVGYHQAPRGDVPLAGQEPKQKRTRISLTNDHKCGIMSSFYEFEPLIRDKRSRAKASTQQRQNVYDRMLAHFFVLEPDMPGTIKSTKHFLELVGSINKKFTDVYHSNRGSGAIMDSFSDSRAYQLMLEHTGNTAAITAPAMMDAHDLKGKASLQLHWLVQILVKLVLFAGSRFAPDHAGDELHDHNAQDGPAAGMDANWADAGRQGDCV